MNPPKKDEKKILELTQRLKLFWHKRPDGDIWIDREDGTLRVGHNWPQWGKGWHAHGTEGGPFPSALAALEAYRKRLEDQEESEIEAAVEAMLNGATR